MLKTAYHKKISILACILCPPVLELAFTAYLILQLLAGCPYYEKDNLFSWLQQISFPLFIIKYMLCMGGLFLILFFLDTLRKKYSFLFQKFSPDLCRNHLRFKEFVCSASLLFFSILYAVKVSFHSNCAEGILSMGAFLAVISIYVFNRWKNMSYGIQQNKPDETTVLSKPFSKKGLVLVWISGLFLTGFIACVTIFRYLSFKAPGYDFGLFAQMFEQMNQTGSPITSYERDGLLSHFAVHISPVFYLMLPVYKLFPYPEILQLLQALIAAAGLFPLMKLTALMNMKESHRILLATAYCFYPALSGSCFYDLHENCFLTVFLLFLFWAMEADSWTGILISTILVCSIKEDAPLYAISTGLYYLFSNRRRLKGIITIFLSGTWMATALWYLGQYGEGSMTYRFSNLLYQSDGSMFDVLKTIIICPAYALMQCFQADRLPYLAVLLIPLVFLPLYRLKISELLLCIPIFLINLMPDYIYQHDIYFQYHFGTTAILFFLFLKHYNHVSKRWRGRICLLTAILSFYAFQHFNLNRLQTAEYYFSTTEEIQSLQGAIDIIPENAVVHASPFIVAHLYQWEHVYQPGSEHEADYVILDLRYESGRELEEKYQTEDWEVVYQADQVVVVYHSVH